MCVNYSEKIESIDCVMFFIITNYRQNQNPTVKFDLSRVYVLRKIICTYILRSSIVKQVKKRKENGGSVYYNSFASYSGEPSTDVPLLNYAGPSRENTTLVDAFMAHLRFSVLNMCRIQQQS